MAVVYEEQCRLERGGGGRGGGGGRNRSRRNQRRENINESLQIRSRMIRN